MFVVFNGPSSLEWRNILLPNPVFGCNFAYRDFDLEQCFAVDRMTVHNIRKDNPRCVLWTKQSNLNLELPEGWRAAPTPGIDSGSFALEQAMIQYPDREKIIIGADGILELETRTVYEYSWRQGYTPREKTYRIHRKTIKELLERYHQRVRFVSEQPSQHVETINRADTLRKINMALHG